MRLSRQRLLGACVLALAASVVARAQGPSPASAAPPRATEQPRDALGRSSPRGTVLGFLIAARKGDNGLARQYLNTRLDDLAAEDLARQLFAVLDARLLARLTELSDAPEGSRADPRSPDQNVVGTITGSAGDVAIMVERVTRGTAEPVWLFSKQTLDAIPGLHAQIASKRADAAIPRLMFGPRMAGIHLFDVLALSIGLPLLYVATALLNRVVTPLFWLGWRRVFKETDPVEPHVLPVPARLLILSLGSRWLLPRVPLSLLLREFLADTATLVTIVAVAWLLIVLNGHVEARLRRHMPASNAAAVSLLRLARRAADVLVVFAAALTLLRRFGVDPTPALAGLGVGGIAVALAAQKTLENVIAGASLIFDQAVQVGDFLKMGDISGTVAHIGLRSTRIRTVDRTVVSVPNSQIANASLETISARDKFWFHPVVGVRYETTPDQLRTILDGIRQLLRMHGAVERDSVRVRLLRFGAFSLDVDVFAYLHARDWSHFLELQEQLLFGVTDIVTGAGTTIALPSQTMYVTNRLEALAPVSGTGTPAPR